MDAGVSAGEETEDISFVHLEFSSPVGEDVESGSRGLFPGKYPISKGSNSSDRFGSSEHQFNVISEFLGSTGIAGYGIVIGDDLVEVDRLSSDERRPL
jgi:hypothetical protein